MTDAPHTLTLKLSGDEMDALWKINREQFAAFTMEAVARKLLQDALIGCGVLALPAANRSKGAQRIEREPK